jgi:hypothetical protein
VSAHRPIRFLPQRTVLLFVLSIAATACVNIGSGTPASGPSYVLEPAVPATVLQASGAAIGVGPVTIPSYLDRNEMVSREGANQLRIDARHSWGAPLDQEVQRVLGENLSRLLSSNRVTTWPWTRHLEIALRIPVRVLQFEPVAGRGVVLVARWQLLSPDATQVLYTRQSEIVEPVPESGAGANAAAMSRALAALAGQIAEAVRATPTASRAAAPG